MSTNLFALVLALIFCASVFGKSHETPACDVLPKPENVVSVPAYTLGKICGECTPKEESPQSEAASKEEPPQYEAANDDLPIFKEEESQKEFASGAYYPLGQELYISPEFDFLATRESISETMEGK